MKRPAFALWALAFAFITSAASAQNFTLGARYSNYSTEIEADVVELISLDTGREGSFGIFGEYRAGRVVLTGSYDRDDSSGIALSFLPIDLADYSRSRFEGTLGYAVTPFFDIEGGVRVDSVEFGGTLFFSEDLDFDHQALVLGINLHTPTIRPVGWYGLVRGYVGTADLNLLGVTADTDTTGFRVETGVQIPLGLSGWQITPAVEYERIETDRSNLLDPGIDLETNRLMLMASYTFGR